jgi:hypothetical protein
MREGWLAAVGVPFALLAAQAAPAAGEPAGGELLLGQFIAIAAILFVVLVVPYMLYNTLLAWLASRTMSFPEATVGKAFRFFLINVLLPVPAKLAAAVGVYFAARDALASRPEAMLWAIAGPILAFVVVAWLTSLVVAAVVYSVGPLRAGVFNTLLWLMHAAVLFVLRVGGCLAQVLDYAVAGPSG